MIPQEAIGVPARHLLRIPAICARLDISRRTWFRWVAERKAPAPVPNLPGHPRWLASEIADFERGLHGGRRYFSSVRRRSA